MKKKADSKEPEKIELAVIPMAICRTTEFTALNGQKVPQNAIDDLLEYDPSYRMAYLYLNPKSAHNHEGETNRAVLGRFEKKHYVKDGMVYGDLTVQQLYTDKAEQKKLEEQIMLMVSHKGGYPSRSLDLIPTMVDGKVKYLFDGVAACGAAKAAVPNLPTINYEKLLNLNGMQMQSFSFNFEDSIELTQESNDMEIKDVQKAIADAIADERKKWQEESAKSTSEAISLALDGAKKDFDAQVKSIREQNAITAKSLTKKDAEMFLAQDNVKNKVFSTQKDNALAILLALEELPEAKIELSMADSEGKITKETKNLAQSFRSFIENLPDIINMSKETDGNETDIDKIPLDKLPKDKEGKPMLMDAKGNIHLTMKSKENRRFELMSKVAELEKLDLADPEQFAKAETKTIELALASNNQKDLYGATE